MNGEDKAWAANWIRHASGNWGVDKDGQRDTGTIEGAAGPVGLDERLRMELRRMQQRRAVAFNWLVANNDYARRLATFMGLLTDEPRASWDNIDAVEVRRKIRMVNDSSFPLQYGKFLAAALRKHAAHHLGLLPPEWLDQEQDNIVPFRAAAATIPREVKRSEPVDDA